MIAATKQIIICLLVSVYCLATAQIEHSNQVPCAEDLDCSFFPETTKQCKDIWKQSLCKNITAFCSMFKNVLTLRCALTCDFCVPKRPCLCESEWSSWSSCSQPCGGGESYRNRECNLPADCDQVDRQARVCNPKPCTEWSQCSRTCGDGTRSRHRDCGKTYHCSLEFQDCNLEPCSLKVCSRGETFRYNTTADCCVPVIKNPFECGYYKLTSNIIGGEEAKPLDWIWMLVLQLGPRQGRRFYYCGATLINERWAITAAHCVQQFPTDQILVKAGILYLRQIGEPRDVASVFIHPDFNENLVADIALLKLSRPLPLASRSQPSFPIGPICLPNGERTPLDANCYATGWGSTDNSPSPSSRLQVVKIRNVDIKACQQAYKGQRYRGSIDKSIICAGRFSGGFDTCLGDSGGPLMCQRCSTCAWYIAGVTSFGSTPCAVPGRPGVYTKVLDYEIWIHETMYGELRDSLFENFKPCA